MPTRYGKLSDVLPRVGRAMHERFEREVGEALVHLQKAMGVLLGRQPSSITLEEVKAEVWKRANVHPDAAQYRQRLHKLVTDMRDNPHGERELGEPGNIRDRFATIIQTVIGAILSDANRKAEPDKPPNIKF